MTIASERIEFVAREMAALGCRVTDEMDESGKRVVTVAGAHWMDSDSVFLTFTPASAKGFKGARDSLFCMIFSRRKFPRKGYAQVEYREAVRHAAGLKQYGEHTFCDPANHHCDEKKCTVPRAEDDRPCGIPESLHRHGCYDHTFAEA